MKYSMLKLGSLSLFVAAAALVLSIACGSSDEEAAPTPDVARIIQGRRQQCSTRCDRC